MSVSIDIKKCPGGWGQLTVYADISFETTIDKETGQTKVMFFMDEDYMYEFEESLKARYGSKSNESDERFKEPTEKGFYATQSGQILLNNGNELSRWMTFIDDYKWWDDWADVLNQLDESEFPLTKLTDDLVKKAVEQ